MSVDDVTDIRDLLVAREHLVATIDRAVRRHVAADPDWLMLSAGQADHLRALISALRTGTDLPPPPTRTTPRSRFLQDGQCIDGHPATEDNTYWQPATTRDGQAVRYARCRTCQTLSKRAHRRRHRQGGAR